MIRLMIQPTTFEVLPMQHGQNPYIDIDHQFNKTKVAEQHERCAAAFAHPLIYTLPQTRTPLPDIVFVANGGLSLPRLSRPMVLLPNMKYPQRRAELPFLKAMYKHIGLPTVKYPGTQPFEGQAELKWFDGGRKAVCGYGHRSNKQTFVELDRFFKKLYGPSNAPALLVLPLISADYYHLDVAMLEYDDSRCIVHRRAFSPHSIRRLRDFLGAKHVMVIDTPDLFCLNAVVDGPNLITHRLTDPAIKPLLEARTGRRVQQVSTTEFEKSGGSVRCMALDMYMSPRV